jgi:hypothetical protein
VNAEHHPLVFPVNYGMDGDTIVLRTAPGTELSAAAHANVTFEVDSIDQVARRGWSWSARWPRRSPTPTAPTWCGTHATDVRPWAPGEHGHWLRLIPHDVTGRRIVPGELPPPVDPRAYL